MLVFCLMMLVGISRSWEAFKMSSSPVTFLTSSRLTFSKENLQPEFSSFILRMLGCFSKVLIVFSIGSLCSLEISQRLMLRPSQYRQNKTKRFPQLCFLPKKLSHFRWVLIFHFLKSFQWSLVYGFPERLMGNLVYVEKIIKVSFYLLNKFGTKLASPFIR